MARTRLLHRTNEPIIEMDGKLNTIAGTRNLFIPRDDPTDLRYLDGQPVRLNPKEANAGHQQRTFPARVAMYTFSYPQ